MAEKKVKKTVKNTRKKENWGKEEVLQRLWRIAEDARQSTFSEKATKDGGTILEYDSKCASIELKALEYAVKLMGMLEQSSDISVKLEGETAEWAN